MIVFNDHRFSGNCYPLKVGSSPTAKAYAENEKDPYKKLKKKKMSIKNVCLYHFWLKRFLFALFNYENVIQTGTTCAAWLSCDIENVKIFESYLKYF